jgi:hypothetical protein
MILREGVVGLCFLDCRIRELSGPGQPERLPTSRPLGQRFLAPPHLARVDRLEHGHDFPHLGRRAVAGDVAVQCARGSVIAEKAVADSVLVNAVGGRDMLRCKGRGTGVLTGSLRQLIPMATCWYASTACSAFGGSEKKSPIVIALTMLGLASIPS